MHAVDRAAEPAVLALVEGAPGASEIGAALPTGFASPGAAVAAEVARIAVMLRRALKLAQVDEDLGAPGAGTMQASRALARLAFPAGQAPRIVDPEIDRLDAQIAARQRANAADRAATRVEMPLDALARRAGLDAAGFDLLVLALAPEIDEGFGRAYQLFGGTRSLDVALAARVLTPGDPGAGAVRRALSPGGALARHGLVELTGPDGAAAMAPMLGTSITVPAPVIACALGHDVEDATLRPFLVAPAPRATSAPTHAPAALLARVAALLADPDALPLLEGPAGAGKRTLVREACAAINRPVLEIDLSTTAAFTEREAHAAARLAWLGEAILVVSIPPHDGAANGAWQRGLSSLLARTADRVVVCRNGGAPSHGDLRLPAARRLSPIWVPTPPPEIRTALWRDQLGAALPDADCAWLARNFAITGGTIRRVADEARILAEARAAEVDRDDVVDALDAELAPQLETVGRRLATGAAFEDLVLADETRESLMELASTICLRDQVLDAWRFRPLVRGRGVSALFYGDPGTGKTMAAGVIANAIGLPLYQIDTASLVSKWVGETEKHLAAVFRAAEARQAILLFDEADAIFGKRTDVQNATDRYANMQTNFLLTQLELFDGVTILTTNRESGMDAAFKRRLTFRVCFPPPEPAEREALWRQMLSGRGVLCRDIDWTELAELLPMSGGYIRNAVLRAGYLAAASNTPITTALLHRAATMVLRDAGKVI